MCSLRVTCRLHVHGAGFGVTCRYAHSEYELGWILKDAATGLMIGIVYDGSEYVVGTERILLPAGHDAVADVSQTVDTMADTDGDTEASKKMPVARESAADYHDDDDWLIGVGTSDGSYRMFRREADEEFDFGTERTHIATSKLKASAFRMQI
ncbi:hypothetical protein DYB34_012269 [Aphanomyces astaci]|uniref:Uncharacterized protein n=1 Tax=Aphanomyces astaci TaxID=112090 RepID=A0A3R7AHU5_APHAT|nr:hypothetical protein DYB34_012269 [Aphanomyces astaci]